jgi:hypothetical protein
VSLGYDHREHKSPRCYDWRVVSEKLKIFALFRNVVEELPLVDAHAVMVLFEDSRRQLVIPHFARSGLGGCSETNFVFLDERILAVKFGLRDADNSDRICFCSHWLEILE